MDYGELIEHLRRRGLGNGSALGPHSGLYDEAALAIETLRDDLARVTAERDAAAKDLKKWNICATCGHYSPYGKKSNCKIKSAHISGGNWAGCSKWEWRGIKED